ncbi:MAG: type II toxin-antitoxin system RelE/ParE family toxin [Beijerinckiaceae bacterium]|jgi:hypothetical protein|nr:type II toxin-antitoxin system RelE/ParE family toxin [Beijerinckiaceae bacterium]
MVAPVSVVETPAYLSRAERSMSAEERSAIVDAVASSPESGVLIQGTGGLRKMRIALAGRGKRGGGRLIYWFHSAGLPAVLLWVFAKNEASDLTASQRDVLAKATRDLLTDFGKKP